MKKEDALARVQDLARQMQASLENHQRIKQMLDNATSAHNALVGRYDEANEVYKKLEAEEKSQEEEKLLS